MDRFRSGLVRGNSGFRDAPQVFTTQTLHSARSWILALTVMFLKLGCNCVTFVFLLNTAHFTFTCMNLKKFKSEVYKSIHFLKAYSVRILKNSVLQLIQGGTIIIQGETKSYVNHYFPSTVHIKQVHGELMCFNVALPITHPCIPRLIIFINVPAYIQGGQKIVWFKAKKNCCVALLGIEF